MIIKFIIIIYFLVLGNGKWKEMGRSLFKNQLWYRCNV